MPKNNAIKKVNFQLTVPNPNDQYLNIECTFPVAQREIEVQLPSWRPGRYEKMIKTKPYHFIKIQKIHGLFRVRTQKQLLLNINTTAMN